MFSVALIGADGAGKSTIARRLTREFPHPVQVLYMGTSLESSNVLLFTSRLILRMKKRSGVSHNNNGANGGESRRNVVWRIVRLLNLLAEEWYRQWLSWRWRKRGVIVVYDRYFSVDYEDDAEIRQRTVLDRIHRFVLRRYYPRPDLVIYLDAPPHVLRARQNEPKTTIEYLQERRESFLRQQANDPKFVRVDATKPADEVFATVCKMLRDRAKKRQGPTEGPPDKVSEPNPQLPAPSVRATQPEADVAPALAPPSAELATRAHLRGSTLLLAGRILSTWINFFSQVIVVRFLSTADYGALAFVLSLISVAETVGTLGLEKGVPRFVPIFNERGENQKVAGVLVLVAGVIASLFAVTAIVVRMGFQHSLLADRTIAALVAVLAFMMPLEAMNETISSVLASFSKSRLIFFRNHLLSPSLKLAAVLCFAAAGASVTFLAWGYLIAALVGSGTYVAVLVRFLRRKNLFAGLRPRDIVVPAREMFSYCLPLLSTDAVRGPTMNAISVFLLGSLVSTSAAAMYRAAMPVAYLNSLVTASFLMLYTPAAARLFAKNDTEGMNSLYWRTAAWMAVLTFPIFAFTFSLAKPLVLFLYGDRYAVSGTVLSVLALGYYVNVLTGFNAPTLRVFGNIRVIVGINLAAAAANIVLNLVLVPRYGAVGGAVAFASSMILLNGMSQAALRLSAGLKAFDFAFARTYLTIILAAATLFVLELIFNFRVVVAALLVVAASVVVVLAARSQLQVADLFPEIQRFRWARAIFATQNETRHSYRCAAAARSSLTQ